MRSILCYGDSNTYGAIPGQPGGRYGLEGRWPGVLRSLLGTDWNVVEEGLPGRTTCSDDPIEGAHLNGLRYIRPCLESHRTLDVIVVMLGTNDLKTRFRKTAPEIALGMAAIVQQIREDAFRSSTDMPDVILVSPPPILLDLKGWDSVFEGGYEVSQNLAEEYYKVADSQGVGFLDAGLHAECSALDGFHIDNRSAITLAGALAELLTE